VGARRGSGDAQVLTPPQGTLTGKTLARDLLRVLDVALLPFSWRALLWLRAFRFGRPRRMPLTRRACLRVGVRPLRDRIFDSRFIHGSDRLSFWSEQCLLETLAAKCPLLKSHPLKRSGSCWIERARPNAARTNSKRFAIEGARIPGVIDSSDIYHSQCGIINIAGSRRLPPPIHWNEGGIPACAPSTGPRRS
jgi:hypothetical protein